MHYCRSWYKKLPLVFLALFLAPGAVYSAETSSTVKEGLKAYKAKDYARARQLFDQACKAGDSVGCLILGDMLKQERNSLKQEQKTLQQELNKLGSEKKRTDKEVEQLEKYEAGLQALRSGNPKRARELLEQVCKQGMHEACEAIKYFFDKQREDTVSYYAEGVRAYDSKEYARARALYEQACKAKDSRGCLNLGVMVNNGEGGPQDKARARTLFDQACKGGSATGCFNLGLMFSKGEGGPQDKARARALFDQACKGGNATGCFNLGIMFDNGEGGPQDKARARELFDLACTVGYATGCFNLGVMFSKGEGGPQDKARAHALYDQACKGGHSTACSIAKKQSTPPPAASRPPAVSGDPERGRALFINGLDAFTAADYPRARSFYEQSCQAGSPTGCEYFALMLLGGTGGPQDTAGARELFDRTCKQGHVDSCVRLKNMQERRADVPPGTQGGPGGTHKPVPDSASAEVKSTPSVVSRPQSLPPPTPAAPPAVRAPRPTTGERGPQQTQRTPEIIAKPRDIPPPIVAKPPADSGAPRKRCALDDIAGTYQTVYGPLVCRAGNGGLDCCYGSRCEKKAKLTLDQSGQNMVGSWRYPDGKQGPLTFPVSSQCALQSGRWADAGQNPNRPWTVGRR